MVSFKTQNHTREEKSGFTVEGIKLMDAFENVASAHKQSPMPWERDSPSSIGSQKWASGMVSTSDMPSIHALGVWGRQLALIGSIFGSKLDVETRMRIEIQCLLEVGPIP